jgi:proteasome assembly chaperone (PAC2) family protein
MGCPWVRSGSVPARAAHVAYPSTVSLYSVDDPGDLVSPTLVAALDGWVDAGMAATMALGQLAADAAVVATFDADRLFDYRARRPPLEIVDGRLTALSWHELVLRRTRLAERDVLILVGPEPDYRWQAFCAAVVEVTRTLGVAEWISLGAIPAAVPHTRPVPILGTSATPGLLRGDVIAGPAGTLHVPSALVSALEFEVSAAGIPALGYFAQVPHYVSGPYASAALGLLRALATHLGTRIPADELEAEARELQSRLDEATTQDETTRTYVQRLEAMYDEQRLPSGDDLISDIERFLRDQGGRGQGQGSSLP